MLGVGEGDARRRAGREAVLSILSTQLEGFLVKLKLGHLAVHSFDCYVKRLTHFPHPSGTRGSKRPDWWWVCDKKLHILGNHLPGLLLFPHVPAKWQELTHHLVRVKEPALPWIEAFSPPALPMAGWVRLPSSAELGGWCKSCFPAALSKTKLTFDLHLPIVCWRALLLPKRLLEVLFRGMASAQSFETNHYREWPRNYTRKIETRMGTIYQMLRKVCDRYQISN